MGANKIYKYINLLFRISIGIFAVGFIYVKLKDDFYIQLQQIDTGQIHYLPIILAFLMLFINWGLEAVKWRYSIREIEKIKRSDKISEADLININYQIENFYERAK